MFLIQGKCTFELLQTTNNVNSNDLNLLNLDVLAIFKFRYDGEGLSKFTSL